MQSLQGGTEAIAHLDQLEADYYDLQLQLYEVQFEILKYEELLLTAQLESIKRLISGDIYSFTSVFLRNCHTTTWELRLLWVCIFPTQAIALVIILLFSPEALEIARVQDNTMDEVDFYLNSKQG